MNIKYIKWTYVSICEKRVSVLRIYEDVLSMNIHHTGNLKIRMYLLIVINLARK